MIQKLNKFYYTDGEGISKLKDRTRVLHRENGPAIEFYSGSKCWYIDGKKHRIDGPDCEWCNGEEEWYLNGERIFVKTNEEFLRIVKLKSFL